MPALIISLVVLVLIAIAIVLRLLVAELSKPATSIRKNNQKQSEHADEQRVLVGAGAPIAEPDAASAELPTRGAPVVAAAAVAVPVIAEPPPEAPPPPPEPEPEADPVAAAVAATTAEIEAQQAAAMPARPPADLATVGTGRWTHRRDVVQTSDGVRVSRWRRVRSVASLVFLVVFLGVGAAAMVGAIVLLMGLIFQRAIS